MSSRPIRIMSGLILSVGLLTSCSGSPSTGPDVDPAVPESKASIIFAGSIDANKQQTSGTRAANLEDKATTFKAYGYKNTAYNSGTGSYSGLQTVFGGYTVTYSAVSAGSTETNQYDWEYVNGTTQTVHYWDFAGTAYRFGAFAPADANVTSSATATDLSLTIPADATSDATIAATPYFAKMWFSNNSLSYTAYGQPVVLTFMQPFSKVRIRFIDADGNEVTTSSIVYQKTTAGSITFIPSDAGKSIGIKGSVTVTYPLTGTDKQETVSTTAGTTSSDVLAAITEPYEENKAFASSTHRWYTVLPAGPQGAYTLSLTYNGNQRTAVVSADYMNWQPGYEYTYVFKLTDDAVTFVPQLFVYTKWQAGYADSVNW